MKSLEVVVDASADRDVLVVGAPGADAAQGEVRVRSLREVEDAHVRFALRVFRGNKKRTAAALGISRDTLYRKIADLDALGDERGASTVDGEPRR